MEVLAVQWRGNIEDIKTSLLDCQCLASDDTLYVTKATSTIFVALNSWVVISTGIFAPMPDKEFRRMLQAIPGIIPNIKFEK